jgi:hypothetical protein
MAADDLESSILMIQSNIASTSPRPSSVVARYVARPCCAYFRGKHEVHGFQTRGFDAALFDMSEFRA